MDVILLFDKYLLVKQQIDINIIELQYRIHDKNKHSAEWYDQAIKSQCKNLMSTGYMYIPDLMA